MAAILALAQASESAPHWSEKAYVQALSGGPGRCLFVVEDSEVRGFAVGSMVEEQAEIESVVVSANSRRRGLGRGLCKSVIEWARAAGARPIALEVRAGNLGAIALYESLEFCVVGRRRLYYAAPAEDALIMRAELTR